MPATDPATLPGRAVDIIHLMGEAFYCDGSCRRAGAR